MFFMILKLHQTTTYMPMLTTFVEFFMILKLHQTTTDFSSLVAYLTFFMILKLHQTTTLIAVYARREGVFYDLEITSNHNLSFYRPYFIVFLHKKAVYFFIFYPSGSDFDIQNHYSIS